MTKNQISNLLTTLGLLPFVYALLLALYQVLGLGQLTGFAYVFARIDSYIYAHSFGVVFFALLAGLQLGLAINRSLSKMYLFSNLVLFSLAWASFLSYANQYGLMVLTLAYVVDLMVAYVAHKEQQIPRWFWLFRLRMNVLITLILLLIILING